MEFDWVRSDTSDYEVGKSPICQPFHSQEWSTSDFPCSLSISITWHSMENLAFHSLPRWKIIILPILATSLIPFSLKVERMYFLKLGVKRLIKCITISEKIVTDVIGPFRHSSNVWLAQPTVRLHASARLMINWGIYRPITFEEIVVPTNTLKIVASSSRQVTNPNQWIWLTTKSLYEKKNLGPGFSKHD